MYTETIYEDISSGCSEIWQEYSIFEIGGIQIPRAFFQVQAFYKKEVQRAFCEDGCQRDPFFFWEFSDEVVSLSHYVLGRNFMNESFIPFAFNFHSAHVLHE